GFNAQVLDNDFLHALSDVTHRWVPRITRRYRPARESRGSSVGEGLTPVSLARTPATAGAKALFRVRVKPFD
ncbi:MAG TPA: hypothetical protein VLQ65_10370, partial [Saliniramus sp.]|nr:hypothetical protein [Saliniramus sp.]